MTVCIMQYNTLPPCQLFNYQILSFVHKMLYISLSLFRTQMQIKYYKRKTRLKINVCICVVIVTMITQRYNLASRNSLLLWRNQNIGNGVKFLYISPQPPFRSWTWLYHQKANSNDILSVWKYSQLFTHESNTFLSEKYVIRPIQTDGPECAQTHRQTHKSENIISAVSLHSLGRYKYFTKGWNFPPLPDS